MEIKLYNEERWAMLREEHEGRLIAVLDRRRVDHTLPITMKVLAFDAGVGNNPRRLLTFPSVADAFATGEIVLSDRGPRPGWAERCFKSMTPNMVQERITDGLKREFSVLDYSPEVQEEINKFIENEVRNCYGTSAMASLRHRIIDQIKVHEHSVTQAATANAYIASLNGKFDLIMDELHILRQENAERRSAPPSNSRPWQPPELRKRDTVRTA